MKKNIVLLTGSPGIGKTTIIKKVVSVLSIPTAGFFTQEIREEGRRVGFEIISLSGKHQTMAHVELSKQRSVGKYGVNLTSIDKLAVQEILEGVENRSLIIIDEIGPIEILSVNFRNAVISAFESLSPILGTIAERRSPFLDKIRSYGDVHLVQITRSNRNKVVVNILEFFQSGNSS